MSPHSKSLNMPVFFFYVFTFSHEKNMVFQYYAHKISLLGNSLLSLSFWRTIIISKQKRGWLVGGCGTNEKRSYDFQNVFFPRPQQNAEYIFGRTSCGMFISGLCFLAIWGFMSTGRKQKLCFFLRLHHNHVCCLQQTYFSLDFLK